MRVAFLGTAGFAVPVLDRLLESGHEVVGVVTGPDKPAGRGRKLTPTPVKRRALDEGLSILTPLRLKDPEFLEAYAAWKPEAAVVVAYRILPPQVFDLPPLGTLNVHPSLLPRYRGPAPLNWALINGDTVTGVSIIRITETVDAGGVVLQQREEIHPFETVADLGERLAKVGGEMVVRALEGLQAGSLKPIEQNEAQVTRAPKLAKEDGLIDWSRTALQVHNRVRGVIPWPGAYSFHQGKTIKLYGSRPEVGHSGRPGQILRADDRLTVACGEGAVSFGEVQLQGKKRMQVEEFLRGYELKPGDHLGE